MAAVTNRLRVDQDGLFTNVEHAVLASWFGQRNARRRCARSSWTMHSRSLALERPAIPTAKPPPPWLTSCLRQSRIGFRSGPAGRATS